ncbi:MAG: pyruvate kinase alpha/beta domain-containing protein [Thermoplasmata archaeon]
MAKSSIFYFEHPGAENTDEIMGIVADRMKRGDIKNVVVASTTGDTARKLISRLKGTGAGVAVVTSQCGSEKEGESEMSKDVEEELIESGAKVVRASHVLSGVERSINRKVGGASRVETVAEALRALFGQGMKVCVEVTIMAADNGAIPCGEVEVIAVAGSGSGADTACVVRPAHANGFFNFQVREILAMPRKW